MSTYQINGLLKFAEEDKWKEGCLPDTSSTTEITGHWTGDTQEEVIKKVADYLSVDKDGIERDACEEPGRVDFAVMEDCDSTPLSKAQIKRWKKGEIKVWYAVYSGIVERVEPVSLTTPEPAGTEINPLHEAALDLLDVLWHILRAHETKNCGAVNGEAILCEAYADQARAAIEKAGGYKK